MKLSIITINYNNAEGLRKTLASVGAQTDRNIEHIIVDAASTDGSVDVIRDYESSNRSSVHPLTVIWSSEPDNGIYDGMNRGIRKTTGDYVQILNSGDLLVGPDIIARMMTELEKHNFPELLYGNSIDVYQSKRISSHGPGIEYSLRALYIGTYPHSSTYFKRELFSREQYGLYDESLKIVSDWKWYLRAIGLGYVKPIYVDIDVALFDVSGISSTNKTLDARERQQVLAEVLPPAIYEDYKKYSLPIEQYRRLKRYHLWGIVYLLERWLFKLEKWGIIRK